MPRWLSSLLIVIGFLALVLLALFPKEITVIVNVDDSSQHLAINEATPAGPNHVEPGTHHGDDERGE